MEFELKNKYRICFACSPPDEPGCGCPDNDFYKEYDFEGTSREAKEEARKISFEIYGGDFRWWIEEINKNQLKLFK